MIIFEGVNKTGIISINVNGKLTHADYQKLLPELEGLFLEYKKLSFCIKLENFAGFELSALWDDIKFDMKHKGQFGKVAVVGESSLEKWATRFSSLFFSDDMRFFYADQEDQARSWVAQ